MSLSDWECVIGLEIHAQMKTESKLFSPDSSSYGSGDNVNTHPVTLGMPGTLPVLNEWAVAQSVKTGLALNCKIRERSVFARKNYFYPDLSKGYQISQMEEPLCQEGYVSFYLNDEPKKVRIERAHMEEDAGKSMHYGDHTLLDYNRAGTPLLEIVSAPEIKTPADAAEYARTVRRILRYLDVCDGNLEEGSMRCDCNISIRKKGEAALGTKVEIKNINSFRFIEKSLEYEFQRQIDVTESGGRIFQETRLYDATKNKTYTMRSKEEEEDYRYFPEPDLLPLELTSEYIESLRSELPELPTERIERFTGDYGLSPDDAGVLSEEIDLAQFFEEVANTSKNAKASANWVLGEFLRELKSRKLGALESPVGAIELGELIKLIDAKKISGKIGKRVFVEMLESGESAKSVIERLGLSTISDEGEVVKIVEQIILKFPDQVAEYKGGKEKVFGFFVGQAMKESKGQADPETLNRILRDRLRN